MPDSIRSLREEMADAVLASMWESGGSDDHFYGAWLGGRASAGGHPEASGTMRKSGGYGPSNVSSAESKAFMDRAAAVAAKYPDISGVEEIPDLGNEGFHYLTRVNADIYHGDPNPDELAAWDAVMAQGVTRDAPFTVNRAGAVPAGLKTGDHFSDPSYTWTADRPGAVGYMGSRNLHVDEGYGVERSLMRINVMPGTPFAPQGDSQYGEPYVVLPRNADWTVLGSRSVNMGGRPTTFWDVSVSGKP
jgi:hypothetical protein